jgi:hypothetical protein
MRNLFDKIPIFTLVLICLTLGLAPFTPEPHVWEKLKMLAVGGLPRKPDRLNRRLWFVSPAC